MARAVSLKHDGTDRTAYTDGTAGLVADGTAIQLLVEQTEQPIQMGQPFMEQTGQPRQTGQLCRCVTVFYLYLSLTKHSSIANRTTRKAYTVPKCEFY